MPYFSPGSTHQPHVTLKNNTDAPIDVGVSLIIGNLPMQVVGWPTIPAGGTATAEQGSVTMPSAYGDYTVYLHVETSTKVLIDKKDIGSVSIVP